MVYRGFIDGNIEMDSGCDRRVSESDCNSTRSLFTVRRVTDSDGQFLLIESAHLLPSRSLTPENSENRVSAVISDLYQAESNSKRFSFIEVTFI